MVGYPKAERNAVSRRSDSPGLVLYFAADPAPGAFRSDQPTTDLFARIAHAAGSRHLLRKNAFAPNAAAIGGAYSGPANHCGSGVARRKRNGCELGHPPPHGRIPGRIRTGCDHLNDADFAMPMRCVRDDLGLGIVLVKPDPKAYSAVELTNSATRVKALRPNHLRQSQFPATLTDQTGKFNKPNSW